MYQSTGSELVLFLRGLSKGLTGEDIGADLGECLGEGEQLISDVQEALADIEKGSADLAAVVNGIFKLIQVIQEVSMATEDCKNVSASVYEKLYEFSLRFADYNALLSRIAMNMFYHGTEIYGDLNTATEYYNKSDYYNAGLYVGMAIEIATQ